LPFVALRWFPIPGRVYPLPFISPLRDLQREINITLSQLVEVKNRQLRADMVIQGGDPPTVQADPETGAKTWVLGLGTQKFEFLRYDLRTTDAELMLGKLWDDMMKIAGIHESSIGQQPSSQVTLGQLQLLKESDVAGLTLFRTGFDQAHAKIARQKILIGRNHYDIARISRVVGESGAPKVAAFFGSDFRNTEDVRPKSMPMISQAMIQQLRRDAAVAGLYGPYAGPEDMLAKVVALLNSGIPDVEQEVDTLIAPMTLADLRALVGRLNAAKAQAAVIQAEGLIDALVLQKQQQEQQAQMTMAQGEQGGEEQTPQLALAAGGAG
jgi:hypothetical protein